VAFWYIFPRFGLMRQEKYGNPVPDAEKGNECMSGLYFYERKKGFSIFNFIFS
jgi:hypothetical protein